MDSPEQLQCIPSMLLVSADGNAVVEIMVEGGEVSGVAVVGGVVSSEGRSGS